MLEPPVSLWWDTLDDQVAERAPLSGDIDVDVAIVGGGFTGLWTARELLERDATLRVAVIEQSVCGFGASGRNGGWASGFFPVDDDTIVARYGTTTRDHVHHVLRRAIDELAVAARADGIDCDFVKGGTLTVARSEPQRARLQSEIGHARTAGDSERDLAWLSVDELRERLNVAGALGATYSPHCARLHPAKLVRGLARSVEDRGARIFERTSVEVISPATTHQPARLLTPHAMVSAQVIVRATEGFTATFAPTHREIVPLYSLMVATSPLSDDFWAETGLAERETFADDRHLIIYGQRTADNRIAFGGRGAPYHFASRVEQRFDTNTRVASLLEATLRELFPEMSGEITHRWGGPLAMPRDRWPRVTYDRTSGLASAGGYTGDGVVLSRVAAQALADLIVTPGATSEFTQLPFVGTASRTWEREPLRFIGINAGLALATWADRHERRSGTESRAGRVLERLLS